MHRSELDSFIFDMTTTNAPTTLPSSYSLQVYAHESMTSGSWCGYKSVTSSFKYIVGETNTATITSDWVETNLSNCGDYIDIMIVMGTNNSGSYGMDIAVSDGCQTKSWHSDEIVGNNSTEIPNAGTDAMLNCGVTSVQLSGNYLKNRQIWTFISGPTNPINEDNRYQTQPMLSGLVDGTYQFQYAWNTMGACDNEADTVTFVVNTTTPPVPTANVLTPSPCSGGPVDLEAQLPGNAGSGVWTQVSPATPAAVFSPNASAEKVTLTNLAASTSYTFRYTATNNCGSNFKDVSFNTGATSGPSPAIIDNEVICFDYPTDNTTLSAAAISGGTTGTWTILSQPLGGAATITSPNSTTTTMTNINIRGWYEVEWATTTGSGSCTSTHRDTVIVVKGGNFSIPYGTEPPNILQCGATFPLTLPMQAEGYSNASYPNMIEEWQFVSGPAQVSFADSFDPQTDAVFSAPGNYVLSYKIYLHESCDYDEELILVQLSDQATPIADAGPDQANCGSNGNFTLNAYDLPAGDSAIWTIVSSTGSQVVITDNRDPNTTVTLSAPGEVVLRWTALSATGFCPPTFDEVTLAWIQADASATPQNLCEANSTTLIGNDLSGFCNVSWVKTAGPAGATIANPNDPATTVSGLVPGNYTFEYQVSYPTSSPNCTDSDVINIIVDDFIAANAGSDAIVCDGGIVNLNAITSGGTWSLISGTNSGTFGNASAQNTTYGTVVVDSHYVFRYTIANGSCTSNDHLAAYFLNDDLLTSTTSNATCGNADGNIDLVIQGDDGTPSFQWNDAGNSTTEDLSNVSAGSYTVTVTGIGGCTATHTAIISNTDGPQTNSSFGPACPNSSTTLNPVISGGSGTYSSYNWETGETTPSISIMPTQDKLYRLTVTDNTGCSNILEIPLTIRTVPSVDLGLDKSICAGPVTLKSTITIPNGEDPYTNFYSEGFETDLGIWTQGLNGTDDDIDWNRDNNGTPSSSTGPSEGANSSSYYIFTEASSNYNKSAVLTSNSFDLSLRKGTQLRFWYHMYGTAMGSLTVQVSTDGGNTWANEWSLSGNQGDQWIQQSVDLSAFDTQPDVQIRFVGLTGSNYLSDMAIDDIELMEIDYGFNWSTGATTQSITVNPTSDTEYRISVTDSYSCIISDTAQINIACKASIGNRVWLDENSDGIQDAGEPGIPGVVVELQDGVCVSGTSCPVVTTDGFGGYVFKDIGAGSYTVKVLSNVPTGLHGIYDEDDGTSGPDMETSVTVSSNQEYMAADFGYNWTPKSDTDSPDMTDTGTFGDRVWNDVNGNSLQEPGESGISNITVKLYNDHNADGVYDNVVDTTITDPYGNYIFDGLTPAAYVVEVEAVTISTAGFNTIPTGDPDGDGNNISLPVVIAPGDVWIDGDFGYQSSSALYDIGSLVFVDVDANGSYSAASDMVLKGVSVALIVDSNANDVWDDGEPVAATTYTSSTGEYLFSDIPDGDYVVVITDTENIIDRLVNSVDPDGGNDSYSGLTLSGTDNLVQNFGYVPANHGTTDAFVGDLVFLDADGDDTYDAGEPGIEGVEVQLLDGDDDSLVSETYTNEKGHYYFGNLAAGNYKIAIVTTSLPSGLINSTDPDGSAPPDDNSGTFTVSSGQRLLDKDFGYKATTVRTIGGTIWDDENADGALAGAETSRFDGVTIMLLDGQNILATTQTDGSGNYSFAGIPAGSYTVEVTDDKDVLANYWHSLGTDSESDPIVVDVSSGNAAGIDFGYYIKGAAIGNFVWIDYSDDGIQDGDEPGLEGAQITLAIDYNGDASTDVSVVSISDGDGVYSFPNLLLDEDYNGDGSGTEPAFSLSVIGPNASLSPTSHINAGSTKEDSDDLLGVSVDPVQGRSVLTKQSDPNTETTEASYDFAFVFSCPSPVVEYAITSDGSDPGGASQTTDFFWNAHNALGGDTSFQHQQKVQKYGSIRSWTYCEHGTWHYYYNPLDPDEYLFAIEHGSNTTPIEYIEIRVDDQANDRYAKGVDDATFVMVRDWHVKTVNDAALTNPVNIRFYFPPNEYKQMLDSAKAQATAWGVSLPDETMVEWFKKDTFDPDADIDETNTVLSQYDITNKRNATSSAEGVNTVLSSPAVENSKNHIQFNGITGFSGGTAMIHINRSALPVELIRFEGKVEHCEVRLSWAAETEENFSHYELQRSTNGVSFRTIKTIESAPQDQALTYQYLDEAAGKLNYYRLKMVDRDGSIEYSHTLNVTTDCYDDKAMLIFPNPAIYEQQTVINVKLYSLDTQATLVVTDLTGRNLRLMTLPAEEGWNMIRLNITNLAAGAYFIQHQRKDGTREVKKFVLQK